MPHVDEELFKESGVKTGEVMPAEPIKQDCEDIAEAVWNVTKATDDPEWGLTPATHREKFLYKAQSVKRSGVADDDFERKVAELLKPPKAKASAVALPIPSQKVRDTKPKAGEAP